jgi:hypothetical protein
MDDHCGPKRTSSQSTPPPTGVQDRPVIVADVSSPTNKAPPSMLNLDDNYSSSDEEYFDPASSLKADHLAKLHKKTPKKPIQNLIDLPELPTLDSGPPVV